MNSDHEFARPDRARGQGGFALILALMALVLLTTLGLTLTATTSTELRIATNFRWSEQAQHNAESGIELGKRYLRQIDWRILLWQSRGPALDTAPSTANLSARSGPEGEQSRRPRDLARLLEEELIDLRRGRVGTRQRADRDQAGDHQYRAERPSEAAEPPRPVSPGADALAGVAARVAHAAILRLSRLPLLHLGFRLYSYRRIRNLQYCLV